MDRISSLKQFGMEAVSFGSPRAIIFNFSIILLILFFLPTQNLNVVPARSVFENVFGFTPYSSGMMRGLSRLLHGDVAGALAFNKLSPLALGVIVFLVGWNVRMIKKASSEN